MRFSRSRRQSMAAPDTPDWSAHALDDFLQVLREICWIAGWATVLVVVVALTLALMDIPGYVP